MFTRRRRGAGSGGPRSSEQSCPGARSALTPCGTATPATADKRHPDQYLSRWLGHSSIQTTLIYLELVPDPSGSLDRAP